jgi:hypothetical protein
MEWFKSEIVQASAVASAAYLLKGVISYFFTTRITAYNSLRGDINEALIFYANIYSNGAGAKVEQAQACQNDLRKLAAKLFTSQLSRHVLLLNLPSRPNLNRAASSLIGLCNCFGTESIETAHGFREKIELNLNFASEDTMEKVARKKQVPPLH